MTMSEEDMVRSQEGLAPWQPDPWRVTASIVPFADEHLWLIERDPLGDPIRQAPHDDGDKRRRLAFHGSTSRNR